MAQNPNDVPNNNPNPNPGGNYRGDRNPNRSSPQNQPQPMYGNSPPPYYPPPGAYDPDMMPTGAAPTGRRGGFNFDINTVINIGIAVGLSALLMLSGLVAPTSSQYKADITRLETDLVNVRAANTGQDNATTSLSKKVDDSVNALSKRIDDTNSKISGFATSSSVNSASDRADQANTKATSATTAITDINTKIADYSNRIAALENTVKTLASGSAATAGTTTGTVGKVTATVSSSMFGSTGITLPANDNTAHTVQFNIKITNGLAKAVNNIQLVGSVTVTSSNAVVPAAATSLSSSTTSIWQIQPSYSSSNYAIYMYTNTVASAWTNGFTVDAGASKNIIMWLTFTPNSGQTYTQTTLYFSPDISTPIDTYDIVQ